VWPSEDRSPRDDVGRAKSGRRLSEGGAAVAKMVRELAVGQLAVIDPGPAPSDMPDEVGGSVPTLSQPSAPTKSRSIPLNLERTGWRHRDQDVVRSAGICWDRPGLP